MPKYFTVDEANALLSELTDILTEMVAIRPHLQSGQREVQMIARAAKRNGHSLPAIDVPARQAQLRQMATRLNNLIERVHSLGAQVKDLEMGLIDFPALRDGREILLCWRLGEDQIRYFHDPESGFAGRQPL